MIDIHNHILYDTDDGPDQIEESVRMIEEAIDQGFDTLILSPHYFPNGPYLKTVAENQEKFDFLCRVVDKAGLPVKLYLGNEIMNAYRVPEMVCENVYKTMGDTCYFMLETQRKGASAESLLNTVRKFEQMGFSSLFAHPERIDFVQEEPSVLEDFIKRGCLIQINYLSLTGYYGEASRQAAEEILRLGLAHFAASDAHQKEQFSYYPQAEEAALKIVSAETWDELTRTNPLKLLNGEPITDKHQPVRMTVSSYIARDNLDFIFH